MIMSQGTWLVAVPGHLYVLVTQTKKGISSLERSGCIAASRYTQTTAWKVQQKLAQVMLDREAEKPVGGPDKRVEMDDAYLGGAYIRRGGKRGRGAAGKTPFDISGGGNHHRGPPAAPIFS